MPRLKKRFGQHFLHDQNVLRNITQSIALSSNDHAIEIGPGAGALTRHLLPELSALTVIELDRDLIEGLQNIGQQHDSELTIVNADILSIDLTDLTDSQSKQTRLIGNLPYNISTPIIFKSLEHASLIQDMHFLLQDEVVDRLTAVPGSKTYGRLSVMVQYACATEKLFTVSPGAFTPPPKVNSALVRLSPYDHLPHPAASRNTFADVVRSAFAQRRKTITNSLKKLLGAADIEKLGINPKERPEQLSVEQFVQLSNHVTQLSKTSL